MRLELRSQVYFSILFCFIIAACQSEDSVNGQEEEMQNEEEVSMNPDVFSFTVSNEQLEFLYESRDTNYELINPVPVLNFNETSQEVKKMKTRGKSASRVRRKSFSVDTEVEINFSHDHDGAFTESKDFRLIAMAEDFCYYENRIGFGLLRSANLFPLFFKYVEVTLNEATNGVYFLIENPNDYYLDKNNYAFVGRRDYYGKIDSYKFDDGKDMFSELDYVNAFGDLYRLLDDFVGEDLYNALDNVLNVRQYMQKIAFDYLVKNGDYTDEIYFFDVPGDNQIRFEVMPWDLDDLFAEVPHEVGVSWGTGSIFGNRDYPSKEDVIADVGDKLIFSIEDDLDYIIAKDEHLYGIYLEELEKVMNLISPDKIRAEFDQIEKELLRFFDNPDIVDQSQYDVDMCDKSTLLGELSEKENLLIERHQFIMSHF